MSHHDEIILYYKECNNAYRDAWGMDKNMQLNLGLWKPGTKNLAQALYQLNEEMANKINLRSGMKILDAGCGVGGTAIHFAKKENCEIWGLSLSPDQIGQAKQNAKKANVEDRCTFLEMDYSQTSFEDNSFDAIIGIESICYAEPKIAFLQEAKRLLKPGGKLAIADNLQGKARLDKAEFDELYTHAFFGCKVKSLDTKENYLENLNSLSFSNIACEDYTNLIKPSIQRLRRFYYPAKLYNLYHQLIGKPFSATQEANTKMCYYLLSSLNKGLWKYGIITASNE